MIRLSSGNSRVRYASIELGDAIDPSSDCRILRNTAGVDPRLKLPPKSTLEVTLVSFSKKLYANFISFVLIPFFRSSDLMVFGVGKDSTLLYVWICIEPSLRKTMSDEGKSPDPVF
tara:strand:- start:2 stop:349 length:348 start_codon:yes stop_codon:yes gene_type:complete